MRRHLGTTAALAVTGALAGALAAGAAGAQERGGTLRVGISQMPPSPDPVVTTFGVNWLTATVACEPLFAIDEAWTPQAMLVESFAYGEGDASLTLTLRDGLGFHSGAPLTAADVVASLERFRESAGIGAAFKAAATAIEAVDERTVRIDLAAPTPIVPGLLSNGQAVIMSAASLEGASATDPTSGLDCTGPYALTEYLPDQGATLTRWDGYQPLDAPSSGESGTKHAWADEIQLRLMPEASIRRDSLVTGEIDVALELPTDFHQQLVDDPGTDPVIVANNQSLAAVFNTQSGPAANVDLRRAIYHALAMEPMMLASVGNPDFYTTDGSWIPDPNSFWYTTAGIDEFGQPDLDRARQHLEASGYDGTPLRWLVATEQYQKHYLTAVTAVQQLQDFGINVEIVEMPMASYIEARAKPEDMDVFSSFLPTYVDPTSIAYLNPTYPGFWTDPAKMELMDRLATTLDPDERKAIFEEVHALIYDQFPFIKFGTEANLYGVRTGTQGFTTSPVGGYSFYNVAPPPAG